MNTITIELPLDMGLLRRLLDEAERSGRTINEVISEACAAYVEWRTVETEKAA